MFDNDRKTKMIIETQIKLNFFYIGPYFGNHYRTLLIIMVLRTFSHLFPIKKIQIQKENVFTNIVIRQDFLG